MSKNIALPFLLAGSTAFGAVLGATTAHHVKEHPLGVALINQTREPVMAILDGIAAVSGYEPAFNAAPEDAKFCLTGIDDIGLPIPCSP